MIATILPPTISAKLKREGNAARALRDGGYPTTSVQYLALIKSIDAITEYAKALHPELFRTVEGTTK